MIKSPRIFVDQIPNHYEREPELFSVTVKMDELSWGYPHGYAPPNPEQYTPFVQGLQETYAMVLMNKMDEVFWGWPYNDLENWVSETHLGVRLTFDSFYDTMDMRSTIKIRARGIVKGDVQDYAKQYNQAYVMNKLRNG